MAREVTRRLNEIDMLGRSLTFKVMKRDPSAPVEPPKVGVPHSMQREDFFTSNSPVYSSWDMVLAKCSISKLFWSDQAAEPRTTRRLPGSKHGGC